MLTYILYFFEPILPIEILKLFLQMLEFAFTEFVQLLANSLKIIRVLADHFMAHKYHEVGHLAQIRLRQPLDSFGNQLF